MTIMESTCRICGLPFTYQKGPGKAKTVCFEDSCVRKGARSRLEGTSTLPSRTTVTSCVVCGDEFTYELRTSHRVKCSKETCQNTLLTSETRPTQVDQRARYEALKDAPCLDCGGRFPPECMDFDHRPGHEKEYQVSRLWECSVDRMLIEIAKCDLICANCHRIRTARRTRLLKYLDGRGQMPA